MEKYPEGKLNDNDEGALNIAAYIEKGRLVLDFGKELSWIGFGKKNLRQFIDTLEEKYKIL